MGQATRRELALGLRSAEASLATTLAVAGGGAAGLGLARLNDDGFRVGVLLVPWICSRDWAPEQ